MKAQQDKRVVARDKKDDGNQTRVSNGGLIGILVVTILFFLGAVGWFVYVMIRNKGSSVPSGIAATNPKTCLYYYQGACMYMDKQPCFLQTLVNATELDPLLASASMVAEMNKYIPSQAFHENGKPEVGLPFLVIYDNTIANLSNEDFMRIIGAGYNSYQSARSQIFAARLESTQFAAFSMFESPVAFDPDSEIFRYCENPNPGCFSDQQTTSLVVTAEVANQMPDETAENRCKNASIPIE